MNKLISVSGYISSGKDSAANFLVKNYKFVKMSFADSVKDSLSVIFGWDRDLLQGITPESREWRETVDTWWAERLNIPHFSPRYAMQYYATEIMRNSFNDQIWVYSLEKKIQTSNSNIVISDCRFKNELEFIKRNNGICIRIFRGKDPDIIHQSELESVNFEYDYYVNNNGDMCDLYAQIRSIIR
jgi:hypothetical protein